MPDDDSRLISMSAANAPEECFAGKPIPSGRGETGEAFSAIRDLRTMLAGSRIPLDADPAACSRRRPAG